MSEPAPSPVGRRLVGVLAGLVVGAFVAVPLFWVRLFVHASFTGCFIGCGRPEPAVGLLWSAVAFLLLAAPTSIGMAVARVRARAAWLTVLLVEVVVVAGWALASTAA